MNALTDWKDTPPPSTQDLMLISDIRRQRVRRFNQLRAGRYMLLKMEHSGPVMLSIEVKGRPYIDSNHWRVPATSSQNSLSWQFVYSLLTDRSLLLPFSNRVQSVLEVLTRDIYTAWLTMTGLPHTFWTWESLRSSTELENCLRQQLLDDLDDDLRNGWAYELAHEN